MIGRPNKASKINRVRFKYCTWNVFAPQKLMYHFNKEDIGWRLNSIVLYLHQNPSVITIDLSSQSFSKSFLGNYQGWRGRFEKWSPCHVSFEQRKTPLKTCWSKLKIWLWRYYILSTNSFFFENGNEYLIHQFLYHIFLSMDIKYDWLRWSKAFWMSNLHKMPTSPLLVFLSRTTLAMRGCISNCMFWIIAF